MLPRTALRRRLARIVPLLSGLFLLVACGGDSPTGPNLSESVTLQGSSTLLFQNAAAFGEHRSKIEQVAKDTLAAAARLIPLSGITIIVRPGRDNVIPEIGIGGRADAGTISLTIDTNSGAWVSSLDTQLLPLLAHEMHHVARFRALGLYANLLDAMVGEGLADHFSVEVAATAPPIWAVALTAADLDTWLQRARQEWSNAGYDHGAWFFGTAPPIPRWAGYSIGFSMIGKFLAADSSRSASELYAEPSNSFAPTQ